MSEIASITEKDVYWTLRRGDGNDLKTELMFNKEKALAVLLERGVIHLNSYWWQDKWPEDARKITALCVNCNDVFAWGCADAEELEYSEIKSLYDHWAADNYWGSAKWCAKKRNQQPQEPVIESMKKKGSWDAAMDALGGNTLAVKNVLTTEK